MMPVISLVEDIRKKALLHTNDLDIVQQFGDWNLELPQADSRSIINVCRKVI